MPLVAACRGARAAAAAAPPLRSRRGAEEGSAPARRLREAEVSGGGGAGPLRPALGDGAFPEQPGRVTLRGLRLAGNSSVAARACRAERERAGAAGGGRRRLPESLCEGPRAERGGAAGEPLTSPGAPCGGGEEVEAVPPVPRAAPCGEGAQNPKRRAGPGPAWLVRAGPGGAG